KYVVIENVPGLFSSRKGADFRAVVQTLVKAEVPMPRSGKWAYAGMVRSGERQLAWRTLDSQHFGVAQRRRRVFLVLGLGSRSAAQMLFEREGLSGDTPQSRAAGEGATGSAAVGIGAYGLSGELDADYELIGTLLKGSPTGGGNPPMVANALTAREGKG